MRYTYNKDFDPPAPFLAIEIIAIHAPARRVTTMAKLDTAADISAIPASLVNAFALEAFSQTIVSGYEGRPMTIPTYMVGIELPEARIRRAEVVSVSEDYALLGRDILNHLYIDLAGPDLMFEIRIQR